MTRVLRIAVAAVLLACPAGRGARRREFDGERAFGFLQQQLAFGPRIPGTPGHERAGDWILTQLRADADAVVIQAFTHVTRRGDVLHLRNFLARFRPALPERVLFLAHWDTRPHADQSANLGAQRLPVPGANDGASGVAVLLGVAGALKVKPPAVGVDLLFVDGEDYGGFADSSDVLIGSRYFAAHQPAGYPPLYAVLFDMVGDKSLDIYYEGNSQTAAPEVVDRVWRTAHDLGYDRYFLPGTKHTLVDDHVPLQRAGIHAIDVVDFDYPFWHTTEDTIDKVSAASLQIVGDVAVALVR
ncbi:MAG: glutamine cyclotransferase [Gemmatimonadetes bacterium]|nr:MAG: glutamine cyclotransferase [Gemmatimonadota bacterium]